MIALRDLNGKIDGRPFKVLAGREIPKDVLKTLDVESMKKTKQIGDSEEKETPIVDPETEPKGKKK